MFDAPSIVEPDEDVTMEDAPPLVSPTPALDLVSVNSISPRAT